MKSEFHEHFFFPYYLGAQPAAVLDAAGLGDEAGQQGGQAPVPVPEPEAVDGLNEQVAGVQAPVPVLEGGDGEYLN